MSMHDVLNDWDIVPLEAFLEKWEGDDKPAKVGGPAWPAIPWLRRAVATIKHQKMEIRTLKEELDAALDEIGRADCDCDCREEDDA